MNSTVARILKVNHGGEYGAIRIYAAQIAVARFLCARLVRDLEELLAHERRHEQLFLSLMPDRGARPCRLMWLWGIGGAVLGGVTALFGTQGVYVCTRAVERTVHRHLIEQIAWLDSRAPQPDEELTRAIADVQAEEIGHLAWAESRLDEAGWLRPLDGLVASVVELLIWLSTQGESSRLAKELQS